jgi:hypothetical protein
MDEQIPFTADDTLEPAPSLSGQEAPTEPPETVTTADDAAPSEAVHVDDIPETGLNSAIQDLIKQSIQTRAELSETRDMFRKIVDRDRVSDSKAVDDDFLKQAREHYHSDPFQGAAMLVGKARDDLARLMDEKIYEAFGAREQFNRLMDDFLNDPSNNSLKGYRDELEFLIRDRGVEPKEAAGFLKTVESKTRKSATRKSEALREVRTRSMTESGGQPVQSRDPDRELTRALQQARNLDEMFAAIKRTSS